MTAPFTHYAPTTMSSISWPADDYNAMVKTIGDMDLGYFIRESIQLKMAEHGVELIDLPPMRKMPEQSKLTPSTVIAKGETRQRVIVVLELPVQWWEQLKLTVDVPGRAVKTICRERVQKLSNG